MTTALKLGDLLRQQREQRGWSQRRLAELLQEIGGVADGALIGKWERGEHKPSPFYREKLCNLFGLTAYELGFTTRPMTTLPISSSQPIRTQDNRSDVTHLPRSYPLECEDMFKKKRRELLQLLTVAMTALIVPLPDLDWDRIEEAFSKPSQLDDVVLRDLAAINKSLWNLYKVTPLKRVMLDGVLGQLKSLISFLENSHAAPFHRKLCVLTSDLSQLLGEILFDCNDYDAARSCYAFAISAAKEAHHYDLWSCALVRHAFLPIYEEQFHDAFPLLQAAQRVAHRGDTALPTLNWVAAVLSDAYAGAGNLHGCQQALDLMDGVRDRRGRSDGGWLRFDDTRLLEQRGACFVKLKQADLAIPVLQEALRQEVTYRRRGMILMDLSLTSLQKGNIEETCSYAEQAVELAAQGSGMLRKGIYNLRNQLTTYAGSEAVKNLDKQLQLLA